MSLLKSLTGIYAGLVALLLFAPLATALETGDRFNQWSAECEPRSGGTNACHIYQEITLTEDAAQKQTLRVSIGYPEGSDQAVAVFLMPLGIWLPRGMTLAVDENEPQSFPVLICGTRGCQTTLQLQPDMIESLQSGSKLIVLLFNANQEPVRIPLELKGFAKGLNALK